ncbi:MAG: polymerase subunit sigma-24 [Lacunisphaera sp.]|nr:polymerase subunit sigma-24 [Lacunisphaera sp.]MDB6166062.1 polymerase subunit sigma-24 [Lacunisphaera sp.]
MNSPQAAFPNPCQLSDPAAAKNLKRSEAAHDADLVQRFNAGDECAFTEIVQRYYPRIRALAKKTVHSESDAEEVAQDTFIRAHRGLAKFRGDSSLATWLHCIGLNLARNRYWFLFRRRRQDTISIDKTMLDGSSVTLAGVLSDGAANPRGESMTSEFLALIGACMARLDGSHREILSMRATRNLSYEEIAVELGINVGTVKSRIARARDSLRALLQQSAPELGRGSSLADFFENSRPAPVPSFAMA